MRGREGTCKPGANYPFPCFVENSRRLRRLRKALLPKVPAGRRTTENSKGDRYLDGEEPWVPLSGTSCGISRDTFLCGRFEDRLQDSSLCFRGDPDVFVSLTRLSNISDRARDLQEDDFPCKNNIPFSKRYGRVTRIGEFLRFFKRITGFFPFKDLTENYRSSFVH